MTIHPQWPQASINEIAEVNPGPSRPLVDEELVSFVPMASVRELGGGIDASTTRPTREVRRKSYRYFEENDVIMAKITPCFENGKIAVARGLKSGRAFGSTEFHVLRPRPATVESAFLKYFLEGPAFRALAIQSMAGAVGQLRVPTRVLAQATLPLPPLEDQSRIVMALEAILSLHASGVANLSRARKRATVLVGHILRSAVPIPGPSDWATVSVQDAGIVTLGRQRAPKYHAGPKMRPYLRVANVFEDRIDARDVMQMHFEDDEFERYRLAPGDVLLNEGQSPELLGRPALYRGVPANVAFTNSLLRFQAKVGISPEWALLVFRRHLHSGRFAKESRITTNIAHLSAGRFKTIEFPVPPLPEQQRIVDETAAQLDGLDTLVKGIEEAQKRAAQLRSAILAAAFTGRLPLEAQTGQARSVATQELAGVAQ